MLVCSFVCRLVGLRQNLAWHCLVIHWLVCRPECKLVILLLQPPECWAYRYVSRTGIVCLLCCLGIFGGLIIPATGEDCLVPSLCRRCTFQPPANECILPPKAQFFFCMHTAGVLFCLCLPLNVGPGHWKWDRERLKNYSLEAWMSSRGW